MTVLLDTNILLRLAQPEHVHYSVARRAMHSLAAQKEDFVIVPQILYELWVVATRSATGNGLALGVEKAQWELQQLRNLFRLLPDTSGIVNRWERLVTQYRIAGKRAHDARLVAAMQFHGINRILTFNIQDFTAYPAIDVLDPLQI